MKKIFVVLAILASFINAKKLVVLDPAVVEIIYMLEAEDQIAAISNLSMSKIWPEEKTSKLKTVGTYTKPNLEKIVELKPDLVIVSFHSVDIQDSLKKLNLQTITLKADSVNDIYHNIEEMGKITGKEAKAQEVIEGIKAKFKSFEDPNLKDKKVVSLFSSTPMMAFTSKTLAGDMLKQLGFVNVADGLEGATPVISPEFILSSNPDFIVIIGGMGGDSDFLKTNPVLAKTNAAKNNKVITVPSSLLLRGTPRIGEGIEKLYDMLTK
ncbi:ABC transporter substrate-binding protein [Campylobacter sp. MOP51]|uniref:ABC transporter substrate-binding protein n=1 Tax=Campylobacter canis TaxID=3378588 RepID=UPI003C6B6DE9